MVTEFSEPVETAEETEEEISEGSQIISTGNREIYKKLGGGIPLVPWSCWRASPMPAKAWSPSTSLMGR
jgi:hypothetical protein